MFKDVDVVLFAHVATNLGGDLGPAATRTAWSPSSTCSKARAPMPPERPGAASSALDAVELMDVGWNFRREHLRLAQRSHYVITNGGDQPNVVPADRLRLVLLPRSRLRPHHGHVAHRRQHGARPRR